MKCEDCLNQIETGGRLARWRARRHMATCARCAEELRAWESFKAAIIVAEPLSDALRSTWLSVATQDASEVAAPIENRAVPNGVERILLPAEPARPISNHPDRRKVVIAVAVCLMGCGLIYSYRNLNRQRDIPRMGHVVPVPATDPDLQSVPSESVLPDKYVAETKVIRISLALELEQLDAEIVETLQGIKQLQQQLERYEVTQRIDALLVQHGRW